MLAVRKRITAILAAQRFHAVVQEVEVPSLGEWEQGRSEALADPEFQKSQVRLEGLIELGADRVLYHRGVIGHRSRVVPGTTRIGNLVRDH